LHCIVAGFTEALAQAKAADFIVLGLGIETCGMNPAHNVNPAKPGGCYQEKLTSGYVFPDQYLELEAHDRTTIDLPQIQHDLAKAVLALGKPTVLFPYMSWYHRTCAAQSVPCVLFCVQWPIPRALHCIALCCRSSS
jgi:hypothetical protein